MKNMNDSLEFRSLSSNMVKNCMQGNASIHVHSATHGINNNVTPEDNFLTF